MILLDGNFRAWVYLPLSLRHLEEMKFQARLGASQEKWMAVLVGE